MLARAHFERLECSGGDSLQVGGWVLVPGATPDSFRILVDGECRAEGQLRDRIDVRAAFPRVAPGVSAGFGATVPLPPERRATWMEIEVAAIAEGAEIARAGTLFRCDYGAGLPSPPPEMMHNVSNLAGADDFWRSGMQYYGVFRQAVLRHGGRWPPPRLLDWGCGCGRISAFVLRFCSGTEVHGCDIDHRAIAWCAGNLQPGLFSTIAPQPPTGFPDASFDAILGCSVLTHLARDLQRDWLIELRRILAPSGLLVVSAQGEHAAWLTAPESALEQMRRDGISDVIVKETLREVTPAEYYREVYQTREYTLREWSKHLEVVEYREAGMGSFQDLVVLRPKDADAVGGA